MSVAYFIGIDVGTQGARVVMLDNLGNLLCTKEEVFTLNDQSREEQPPMQWWSSCLNSLKEMCSEMSTVVDLSKLRAIAVTSTSGTIIPIDKDHSPLHHAIMYSDPRSAKEADVCKKAAVTADTNGYAAFNTSSGLPKMIWFINNFPGNIASLYTFIHAADFITGKLCGNFETTDYTNALKSGYDLHTFQWPEYITSTLSIKKCWLQQVVSPGTPIGKLNVELVRELGLSPNTIITAGMTDGCASQIASGAVNIGDWNTTIGTTMVLKGVTRNEFKDPSGAIYCHRHPDGYWMPGGASNTGADWINRLFGDENIDQLTASVSKQIPSNHLAWPLMQKGERFPFVAPQAMGFAPADLTKEQLFTAYLEGVAYIERYAYEAVMNLSGEAIKQVFTAGGGSKNDIWLRIRSAVLNLPLIKMKNVSGAAGAAILAASQTYFSSIVEAARLMTQAEKMIKPDPVLVTAYEENYQHFITLLKEKDYLQQ